MRLLATFILTNNSPFYYDKLLASFIFTNSGPFLLLHSWPHSYLNLPTLGPFITDTLGPNYPYQQLASLLWHSWLHLPYQHLALFAPTHSWTHLPLLRLGPFTVTLGPIYLTYQHLAQFTLKDLYQYLAQFTLIDSGPHISYAPLKVNPPPPQPDPRIMIEKGFVG